MDYTVSLQHQLAVFPTHVYQGYSVEFQVLLSRLWLPRLRAKRACGCRGGSAPSWLSRCC